MKRPGRAAIDRAPLDDLVASFAAERHCPTISWGVVRDGTLELSGAVGNVTRHTTYRIASMTKSFSAAATLLLRDDGMIRLDDPVDAHDATLSGLRFPTDDAPPITIRDLLAMTSGLVIDDPWADRHLDLTDEEFDRIVAGNPVFALPTGTGYEYSNFGFAILGRVVQAATGRRIQDVITDRLLAPLEMSGSTWTQPDHDDWVAPKRRLDDRFVDELAPLGDGLIAPMGGIWSNVVDLARWVAWLDDAFPARDGRDEDPLSRASRREMQTSQQYAGMRTLRGVRAATSYGYGLRILDEPALGTVVSHSGGFPGYGSNMRWLPGRRLGVIALANATYAPMTELAARITDVLDEQGVVPAEAQPVPDELATAGRRLVDVLNDWHDEEAQHLFADNVDPDESFERRRDAAEAFTPLTITSIEATNAARGTVVCDDRDGNAVRITYALAPARPPSIQQYTIERDRTR